MLSVLAAVLAGCPASRTETVSLPGSIEVHIAGLPEGFDKNDPRLLRTIEDLERIVGHGVEMRFALDQMPRYAFFFEGLVDSELGKLPRDLAPFAAGEYSRPCFERHKGEIRKIVFDYDGSSPQVEVAFDQKAKTIRLLLNGGEIPGDAISRVLGQACAEDAIARYESESAGTVPAEEYADYFAYLTLYAQEAAAKRADENEPDRGRSEIIVRVLELAKMPLPKKLAPDMIAYALGAGEYIESTSHEDDFASKQGPDSAFRRAEKAWLEWFEVNDAVLAPEDRARALGVLFVHHEDNGLEESAFPAFDRASYGLEMLEKWKAAGFPETRDNAAPSLATAFELVICRPARPSGMHRYFSGPASCKGWYHFMLLDERRRNRLVDDLLRAGDDRLLTHGVLHAIYCDADPKDVMAFVAAFKKDRSGWEKAARVLGEEVLEADYDLAEPVYDEAARMFRESPRDRGLALFWLVRVGRYGKTSVNWGDFARVYGSLVTEKDFVSYMGQGLRAFEYLGDVWPALTSGWSRWAAVRPHVEKYLELVDSSESYGRRYYAIENIAHNFADHKERDDLVSMKLFFEERSRRSPADERKLRELVETLASCLSEIDAASSR